MADAVTRREFLASAIAVGAAATMPLAGQGLGQGLASDPMRPQFHLLPAHNWMNDPNGPIYFNGRYHMFFQYNPHGAVWGDMSWNHAVSSDMLHWSHLPVALTPTPGSPDAYGVFSGSALQVGKRVYAVYTGTKESTPELATIRDGTDKIQESQCLAWSDDPRLVSWTKDPQPVIPLPPAGMKITGFRDPSAWRQGEWYYMTVGSGVAERGGCVLLYRSKDLKSWEYLHELTSGAWNGKHTANPCEDGEMWECPEFFALDGGHVLIYSTVGKVFWQSGVLDPATMKFAAKKTGLLDLDAFYAPKTQLDAQGRRILWGWIPERRSEDAMRKAGWSGMMTLPRMMNLDEGGNLRLEILPDTASLRTAKLPVVRANGELGILLAQASGEIHCSAASSSAFELTMSLGSSVLVNLVYDPGKHCLVADGKEILLEANDVPSVHAFVDGSVIELILGRRIGYTRRFYYEQPTAPDVRVSIKGAGVQAEAWKIAAISTDRLTTPARQGTS